MRGEVFLALVRGYAEQQELADAPFQVGLDLPEQAGRCLAPHVPETRHCFARRQALGDEKWLDELFRCAGDRARQLRMCRFVPVAPQANGAAHPFSTAATRGRSGTAAHRRPRRAAPARSCLRRRHDARRPGVPGAAPGTARRCSSRSGWPARPTRAGRAELLVGWREDLVGGNYLADARLAPASGGPAVGERRPLPQGR